PMATRYSVAPILLLAGAAAIVLGARRATKRALGSIFVVWVAVVSIVGFRVENPRSLGPSWPQSVTADYRTHCVRAPRATTIRVVPPYRAVNPAVVLPCR
ncbi:MAG TPA: hypothetical protein VMT43_06050, partial [Acidimicrobiales bacterium]|nr:hypothetical protein [Acidimicrobiales bacterium]